MLDIGTGNGLIPCLMLEMSDLETAIGIDPYLDGTHQTSWQVHDHNKALLAIKEFLEEHCRDKIDYSTYQHLLEYENYSLRPGTIAYTKQPSKQYLFQQVGAHDLEQLKDSFDIIYCKAIEHIPNWKAVFESIASVAQDHAILYFKHRSFFSYLGAHRYASINTPWGHVLLTEKEYRRFVEEFFPNNAEKIQDFFFKGLTYPRITVSQMIKLARDYDFVPVSILSEPPRYIDTVYNFTEDVDGFWNIVQDNFPELSADELFSGIYHIVFRKAA